MAKVTVVSNGRMTGDILEEFYRLCFTFPENPINETAALLLAKKVPFLGNARPPGHDEVPTVLCIAICSGMPMSVIQTLVENGADASICGRLGTALHTACEYDREDVVSYIAEKFPQCLSIKNGSGKTPLEFSQEGHYDRAALALTNIKK